MSQTKLVASVPLVVGVTGHRDLVQEELPALQTAVAALFSDLRNQFPDLPLLIVTGLADGADQLVAQVAHDHGHRVINLLPMRADDYRRNFSEDARTRFDALLDRGETFELPLSSDDEVSDEAQYAQLGVFLAAHSHVLLALWDGRTNNARGGTSQVIEFHQRDTGIDAPQRSSLDFADDESDLVAHIACSRESTGAPAAARPIASTRWLTRDDHAPESTELPERYARVFNLTSEFNREPLIDVQLNELSREMELSNASHRQGCQQIERLYQRADALATRYQRRTLFALRATLGCALLAGLCFIVFADLNTSRPALLGYFSFIATAMAINYTARQLDWHRKYLDYRVLAEGLRVQFYWAVGGVGMVDTARYSHDSFLQGRDLELGWIRNVMRYAGTRSDAQRSATDSSVDEAIRQWVGDTGDGQLGYYKARSARALTRHQRTLWLTSGALVASLATAAILLAMNDPGQRLFGNLLIALMGLLPLVAAARQNYAHRIAERELAAQYAHMSQIFGAARRQLAAESSTDGRREILRHLGEASLHENAQWLLRQRERPLPGGDLIS